MQRDPFSPGLGVSGMSIMVVGLFAANCVGAYVLVNHMHGLAVPFSKVSRVASKVLTYQDFDFHEGNRVTNAVPARDRPSNDSVADLDLVPFVAPELIRPSQEVTSRVRLASDDARLQLVDLPTPQFGNSPQPEQAKSAFDAAFDATDPFAPLPLLVIEPEPSAQPQEADVPLPVPQAQSFGGLALNFDVAEDPSQLNGDEDEVRGGNGPVSATLELPASPEPAGEAAAPAS